MSMSKPDASGWSCECSALTERGLNAVTERDVRAGCGLLIVERVVDRVPCTLGACCAS